MNVPGGPMYLPSIGTTPLSTSVISQPPDSMAGEATPDLLESTDGRALPEVPSPDLRRRRRAGTGRADASERDRERSAPAGVPVRGPARHREDLDGAHSREERQLHPRPDDDARQHLP